MVNTISYFWWFFRVFSWWTSFCGTGTGLFWCFQDKNKFSSTLPTDNGFQLHSSLQPYMRYSVYLFKELYQGIHLFQMHLELWDHHVWPYSDGRYVKCFDFSMLKKRTWIIKTFFGNLSWFPKRKKKYDVVIICAQFNQDNNSMTKS